MEQLPLRDELITGAGGDGTYVLQSEVTLHFVRSHRHLGDCGWPGRQTIGELRLVLAVNCKPLGEKVTMRGRGDRRGF